MKSTESFIPDSAYEQLEWVNLVPCRDLLNFEQSVFLKAYLIKKKYINGNLVSSILLSNITNVQQNRKMVTSTKVGAY